MTDEEASKVYSIVVDNLIGRMVNNGDLVKLTNDAIKVYLVVISNSKIFFGMDSSIVIDLIAEKTGLLSHDIDRCVSELESAGYLSRQDSSPWHKS
jgi:hypothetical protein